MTKVIQFETELANITTPSEDRRDEEGLYNPYTIKEWQKVAPFLNWTMFFNDAFGVVNRNVSTYIFFVLNLSFKRKLIWFIFKQNRYWLAEVGANLSSKSLLESGRL